MAGYFESQLGKNIEKELKLGFLVYGGLSARRRRELKEFLFSHWSNRARILAMVGNSVFQNITKNLYP